MNGLPVHDHPMPRHILITGVIVLFCFPPSGYAFPTETAGELQKECEQARILNPTTDNVRNAYSCRGYMQAVLDRDLTVHYLHCPQYKGKLTLEKYIDMLLAWAARHPESLSANAADGIVKASEASLGDCSIYLNGRHGLPIGLSPPAMLIPTVSPTVMP